MDKKYIQLTADIAVKGEHVEKGTVLALDKDDPAAGNILAAQRGKEVDAAAYDAWLKASARAQRAAA